MESALCAYKFVLMLISQQLSTVTFVYTPANAFCPDNSTFHFANSNCFVYLWRYNQINTIDELAWWKCNCWMAMELIGYLAVMLDGVSFVVFERNIYLMAIHLSLDKFVGSFHVNQSFKGRFKQYVKVYMETDKGSMYLWLYIYVENIGIWIICYTSVAIYFKRLQIMLFSCW